MNRGGSEGCTTVGRRGRAWTGRAAALALMLVLALVPAWLWLWAAGARAQPVELAAPYEYMGWGDPQPPAEVLADSGLGDLTLAFVLSKGKCNPAWDGHRPLLGGVDQQAIEQIRAAGGEVDVSFGGWSGKKLGAACKTSQALAAAYQKVVAAYSLQAIDIDIEHNELRSAKVRQRVTAALALLQGADPGLEISVTFPSTQSGPDATGRSLIADAVASGLHPDSWTIMPFDFGPPVGSMAAASVQALEALAGELASAYGITRASAYEQAGISTMNGDTDQRSETVSEEDFAQILSFASEERLARVSFWSVNRDRPCGGGDPEEECDGIQQSPFAFSTMLAGYTG
ncbi:MAG TPA: chitinase [Solirubrobacteraceae bacterium]|nr:chitinase [Solirubrobacteraceae bacterium]